LINREVIRFNGIHWEP